MLTSRRVFESGTVMSRHLTLSHDAESFSALQVLTSEGEPREAVDGLGHEANTPQMCITCRVCSDVLVPDGSTQLILV